MKYHTLVIAVLLALCTTGLTYAADSTTNSKPVEEVTAEGTTHAVQYETAPAVKAIPIHPNGTGVTAQPKAVDDFYMHVNYDWIKKTNIPPEDSSYGSFQMITDTVRDQLTKITKNSIKHRKQYKDTDPQAQIADMYASITDEKSREAAGLGNVEAMVKDIEHAQTLQEYADIMAKMAKDHGTAFWLGGFSVAPDPIDNDTYVVYLNEPSTGMGKEFLENPANEPYFKLYKNYIKDILVAYGRNPAEAAKTADDVFTFQKDLADHAMSIEDLYNPSKATHKLHYNDVRFLYGHINTKEMLNAAGIGPDQGIDTWYVQDLGLVQYFNDLYTDGRLPMLKEYAIFKLISSYAPYANKKYADINEEFIRAMSGAKVKKSTARRNEELNERLMALPYGKLYASQYFDDQRKGLVTSYVKDILAQYKEDLTKNDWLSPSTKQMALKKLDTMGMHIGYPDKWQPFMDDFVVLRPEQGGALINNVLSLNDASWQYDRQKIGKPVDKGEWDGMMPQTVNAFYDPSKNDINFPAAILQAPFFDAKADKATNLGGIGLVIAHEITHSFDSNGAQYDEKGRLRNWWTPADWAAFNKRLDKIIALYNRYELSPGVFADGKQTLSENIADLGAMACLSRIIGDDPDALRRMYTNYALVWREKETEAYLRRVMTDVHSLSYIRVNAVLSSTDPFYEVFDVQPGDGMYIAPDERAKLW